MMLRTCRNTKANALLTASASKFGISLSTSFTAVASVAQSATVIKAYT